MYTVQLITKCAVKCIYVYTCFLYASYNVVQFGIITTLIVIHSGHNVGDFLGEFRWNSLVVHHIQPVKHIL